MSSALKFFSTAILGALCLVMLAGCEPSSSKEVRKLGKYNRNYDSYQQDFDFKSDDFLADGTLDDLKNEDVIYRKLKPNPTKPCYHFPQLQYVQENKHFDKDRGVDYNNSGMQRDEARKSAEPVSKTSHWEFSFE